MVKHDKSTIIGLGLTGLFILIVIIVTATRNAPYLMTNSLVCLGLAIVFIFSEQASWGWWHRYRESENRFWCLNAMIFAMGVLFAPDSPLCLGAGYPKSATALVLVFVLYVNHWERSLARRALANRSKANFQHRFPSAIFPAGLVNSARHKLQQVQENLDKLDYKFAVSKTWNQLDILRRERRIVAILRDSSTDELNYILTNVNLALLFYKIKDNDLLTPARLLNLRRVDSAKSSSPHRPNDSAFPLVLQEPTDTEAGAAAAGADAAGADAVSDALSPSQDWPNAHTHRERKDSTASLTPDISPALLPVASPSDIKPYALPPPLPAYMLPPPNPGPSSNGGDKKLLPPSSPNPYATPPRPPRQARKLLFDVTGHGGGGDAKTRDAMTEEDKSCWGEWCGGLGKDKDARAIARSVRNRTEVLRLILKKRLPELKIEARASAISAMQRMPMSAHPKGEKWVANVVLNTYGESLRKLKHLVDTGGDVHNLHKLVYVDLRDKDLKVKVLDHLDYEGKQVLQYRKEIKRSTLPFPNSLMRPSLRKILSDVDDTLFSSGARFPAGIDNKYEHHTLYPGVLTFYKELDLGLADNTTGNWPKSWRGNLAFLSARPHIYKDWSQKKSYELFRHLKQQHNLHTTPTLLAGELFSSFQMFRGDFEPMAQKKVQNFREFAALYPEYTFVFIGDNGQGDVTAAEKMIEQFGARIEAVFIHKVQKLHLTPGYAEDSLLKWDKMGIVFFKTYVGACLEACKKGLVSIRGLQAVAENAVQEFGSTAFKNEEQRYARHQELNRDIERCNDYLRSEDQKQVGYIPAEHRFARGSLVLTDSFGVGRVVDFRQNDGMYEIAMPRPPGTRTFILGRKLRWAFRGAPGDRVWTPYGTGVLREARERDGVHVVVLGKTIPGLRNLRSYEHKDKHQLIGYLQPKHIQVIKAAVGDSVTTAFGQGIVQSFRKSDGVFEVLIPWGNYSSERSPSATPSGHSPKAKRKGSVWRASSPSAEGVLVRAYLVASQIHRIDQTGPSRCNIS